MNLASLLICPLVHRKTLFTNSLNALAAILAAN